MIDNRDNLNRPGVNRDVRANGTGWGLPLGLAAVALVAGLLFFNWSGDRTTTASNTGTTTTQSTPATRAPVTTPAPATTPARPATGG